MKIIQTPSPNFDERTLQISLLILHYTGMESAEAALAHMRNPEAKVSAHYMIDERGEIYQLIDEDKRAWHAGLSEWQGETDINSASIGIEIVNGGHNFPNKHPNKKSSDFANKAISLPQYPDAQINAVIALSKAIIHRHGPLMILGHSDIAPARKIDPGEHFPWQGLAAAGLGFWPDIKTDDRRILFELGSRDRGVAIVQRGLAHIGYGARVTGIFDEATKLIIEAVQRRYRPDQIDGVLDIQTMEIVKALTEHIERKKSV